MENFAKNIFDIVITHNDEIPNVKHVLDPLCMFFLGGAALHTRGPPHGLGGGGAELKGQPFPPAPRPLRIATRTIKVQYPLCVFFTRFGCGGWVGWLPRGLGHNLLMQFSNPGSSKMVISETDFFDILTIENDKVSYVKHVSAPLHLFFTLFGCFGGGGGGPKGARPQPAHAVFQPRQLKNRSFRN